MKVIKRNGSIEDYDLKRIVDAVSKTYVEVYTKFDMYDKEYIEKEVKKTLIDIEEIIPKADILMIDDIHKCVEDTLMKNNRELGNAYIYYREQKRKRLSHLYDVYYSSKWLNKDFLSKYPSQPDKMKDISVFTYMRTYARDIVELGRRENWKEICIRTIDHNIELDTRERTLDVIKELTKEAELLFDAQFNLRMFVSGRSLFAGGSKAAERNPMSLFNCAFIDIDNMSVFHDILYALSVGSGIGYRVTKDSVNQLPKMRTDVIGLELKPYEPKPKHLRLENTKVEKVYTSKRKFTLKITVGDSREGWATAVDEYINVFVNKKFKPNNVYVDFDNVRKKDELLVTFGGKASGAGPLYKLFSLIHEVMSGDYKDIDGNILTKGMVNGKIRPIHVFHIANGIANAIVVGGVRRSAMICLCDEDDFEIRNAKKEIKNFQDPKISHYFLSNNSIYFNGRPEKEVLKEIFNDMRLLAEPGLVNGEQAESKLEGARGLNPCVEIILRSLGMCNLVTYFVSQFVKDGKIDFKTIERDIPVLVRTAVRVTLNTLDLPEWNKVQEEDRLLGVSPSAWMDMIGLTNIDVDEEIELMEFLYDIIKESANKYCDTLEINRPKNYTAVKPSGTASIVANAGTPGVHSEHSKYSFRTIRLSKGHPLYNVVRRTNWRIEDNVVDPNSVVVYFPVKSSSTTTKKSFTVTDQLERYLRFQRHYSDQNTSITVDVKEGEWDTCVDWVYDNWDEYTGISFMSFDDSKYLQAPYIEISEEEYLEAINGRDKLDYSLIVKHMDILSSYEDAANEESCSSGACGLDRI